MYEKFSGRETGRANRTASCQCAEGMAAPFDPATPALRQDTLVRFAQDGFVQVGALLSPDEVGV